MTKQKAVSGIAVPMLTPFNENGGVDFHSCKKIIDNFLKNDVHPFLLGTTGEGISISSNERKKLIEFVGENYAGKTKIYATVGNNCTIENIENAKIYSDLGVDFIVTLLPGYYQLTTNQIMKYFETMAENSPKPIILYNIPQTTHHSIPLDVVEKLSYHPNIVGLKDSERDIERLDNAIEMFKEREDFSFMGGWGAKSFYSLSKGSDGLVPSTANIAPGMFKEMYDSVKRGDLKNAERLQLETDEIAKIYQKDRTLGQSLAAAKVIMKYFSLCEPYMLPPLTRLASQEEESIINSIRHLNEKIRIY